jgi:hypothetical protein
MGISGRGNDVGPVEESLPVMKEGRITILTITKRK